jgi:carotenoid cleavage dioxygenase-like enzyme
MARYKNTKAYRFAYGLSLSRSHPHDFINQLVKLDVQNGEVKTGSQKGCYPGEPVFVSSPEAKVEDDGLILSVVLDTRREKSFLLILDAPSLQQIARAEVPHPLPFGFHGQFIADD